MVHVLYGSWDDEGEGEDGEATATTSTYEIGCLTRIPTPFQHFGTKANSSVDFEGRPATTITFVLGGHLIHTYQTVQENSRHSRRIVSKGKL